MLTKLVPILLLLVNLSVFTNSQGGLSVTHLDCPLQLCLLRQFSRLKAADPSPDTATTVSTEEMASNKEETGGAGGLVAGTDSETITTPSAPSILLTTPVRE